MADNRKYYYLKLKEGFFESEEIKILESMKDGYIYSNILLKLYLRSLRNEGRLMYRNVIPYTPEILATLVGHQVGTVEKALEIFRNLELIEILDNGAIYMMDIQNFIGQSSTEADRQRAYYNRVKGEKALLQIPENGAEPMAALQGDLPAETKPEGKLLREAIQQTAGCERLSSEEEHLAETVQEVGSEDRWRFVGHGVV